MFSLKDKAIKFGSPHRIEMMLIFAYALLFMWWDLLQNKILDLGIDYRVSWLSGITTSALDLAIIILILFHIALMGLFLMSLKSKSTHRFWDILVGTLAFFGVAIVLAGFINDIYSPTIRFLFVDMASVNFYHLGVGLEIFAGLYWATTK